MLLADVAAAHVENASRLGALVRTSEELETALESRVVLEQAKGILASYHDISLQEAFDLIRRGARTRHISIREVAEGIVDLGLRP